MDPLPTFVCAQDACTGCGACVSVCPVRAVRLMFFKGTLSSAAVIDTSICRDCSLCRSVCPVLRPVSRKPTLKTYAGWVRDPLKARLSASGGVAWQLTEQVILDGGVVYGAAYSEDGILHHTRAKTLEKASTFRLSKYVQSCFHKCLPELKKDLDSNRKVLLTGTPCQIAAAYRFLKKDYPNLITVDLVCHGVPDQQLLSSYIRNLIGDEKYSRVRFRNVHGFEFSVSWKKKRLYHRSGMQDPYMAGFMYGYTYRRNCYSCPYAVPERVSDLTLGDFWGLKKDSLPSLPLYRGISLCMVHTEKGRALLDRCKGELCLFERTEEEAVQGNNQLRSPFPEPFGRKNIEIHFDGQNLLELLRADRRLSKIRMRAFLKAPAAFFYHFLQDLSAKWKMRRQNNDKALSAAS